MDPRNIQIFILIILNIFGLYKNILGLNLWQVVLVPIYILIVQKYFDHHFNRPFNYKSAFISSLSLVLLLNSNSFAIWFIAGFLVIASKFLIRSSKSHIFNPTNFGIVTVLLLFGDQSWVNLSGFGTQGSVLAAILFMGSFVAFKSTRLDVPFYYLGAVFTFLGLRMVWLGDPLNLFFHRLESVSLLIFAFLMISDPKTTPDSSLGRFLFCLTVASFSFILEYSFYIRESHFYALYTTSLILPLLNKYFPGRKFKWNSKELKLAL